MPNSSTSSGEFPSTHWSLIRAVQRIDTEHQREILGQFLETYLPALRAHLRYRKFFPNEIDNEDLLSEFITDKLIAGDLLSQVRQENGLLRAFLKRCLDNFACSRLRKREPLGLAHNDRGQTSRLELWDSGIAVNACTFDIEWARTVVARSIDLMYEDCMGSKQDSSKSAMPHVWTVFEARLVKPITSPGEKPTSYEEIMRETGADSIKQVQNWLVTAQRKFEKHIYQIVREYTSTHEQARQEINDLFNTLSSASALQIEDDANAG